MVENVNSEGLKTRIELVNILRWEDDGGKITEINNSMIDLRLNLPLLVNGATYGNSLPD
jgi:hypothetical protein